MDDRQRKNNGFVEEQVQVMDEHRAIKMAERVLATERARLEKRTAFLQKAIKANNEGQEESPKAGATIKFNYDDGEPDEEATIADIAQWAIEHMESQGMFDGMVVEGLKALKKLDEEDHITVWGGK